MIAFRSRPGFGAGLVGSNGAPRALHALLNVVTPGYAKAMGLRLVDGRFFMDRDPSADVFPFIVNVAFVRTYFNDGRPSKIEGEVVGVVFASLLDTVAEYRC